MLLLSNVHNSGIVLQGLIPCKTFSVGSDTLQDLVLQHLIPSRILVGGVSDPTGKLGPHGIRQKSFESLPFPSNGHFSKIIFMHILHYPKHKGSMLKEPLVLKIFFVLIARRTTSEFEYLQEFKPEFEIIFRV
jgi:hypothetical protein